MTKRSVTRLLTAALAGPLLATCYAGGCTADVLRDVASGLDNVANDLDGGERDVDFGDFLADLVEDF